MSNIEVVRAVVYRSEYPPGILDFDELYINALAQKLGISKLDAEAKSSPRALSMGWTYFQKSLREECERGLAPVFAITNTEKRQVIWLPHYDITPRSRVIEQQRRIIASRWILLNAIDGLTSRQFEALGCVVAELLGAPGVELTPAAREGGIDFYARLVVRQDNHLFSRGSGGIRIVGQCKKWGRAVEPEDVKAFIGTLDEVRFRSAELPLEVPAWFRAARGPIVGWIISESGFGIGARSRAHNHGLLFSNAIDLAELISGSRKCTRCPLRDRGALLRDHANNMLARFP